MIESKTMKDFERKKKIIIITRDNDNHLIDLIKEIKARGNCGHSFSVEIEPEGKYKKRIFWDGDGNDYIFNIIEENLKNEITLEDIAEALRLIKLDRITKTIKNKYFHIEVDANTGEPISIKMTDKSRNLINKWFNIKYSPILKEHYEKIFGLPIIITKEEDLK